MLITHIKEQQQKRHDFFFEFAILTVSNVLILSLIRILVNTLVSEIKILEQIIDFFFVEKRTIVARFGNKHGRIY